MQYLFELCLRFFTLYFHLISICLLMMFLLLYDSIRFESIQFSSVSNRLDSNCMSVFMFSFFMSLLDLHWDGGKRRSGKWDFLFKLMDIFYFASFFFCYTKWCGWWWWKWWNQEHPSWKRLMRRFVWWKLVDSKIGM